MIKLVQNAFVKGQLDYELMGRQDYDGYRKGASKLKNFTVMRQGGLMKRPGFDRILDLTKLDGIGVNTKVRLVPFAYKKDQGFVLVFAPGRIYAVEASPSRDSRSAVVIAHNISGANGVYLSKELDELDYQQCGDVLFIVHQNHKPAKITHTLDFRGDDVFTYEVCKFNVQRDGVPEITNGQVKRAAVSASGGTKTEEYKAAAVFDGVETYPCTAFKDTNVQNSATNWNGTTYYLPWTESQTIDVKIKVNGKQDENGATVYPDKILVYRKNFNYFGLVGTIELNNRVYSPALSSNNIDSGTGTEELKDYNYSGPTDVFSGTESRHGLGRLALSIPEGEGGTVSATLDSGEEFKTGVIKLELGSVHTLLDSNTASVTIHYEPNKCPSATIVVYDGGGNMLQTINQQLPLGESVNDVILTRGQSESEADFNSRVEFEKKEFEAQITDTPSIEVPINLNADMRLFSITVDDDGDDETDSPLVVNMISAESHTVPDTVTFTDKYYTPDSSMTPLELPEETDGLFASDGNYPGAVCLTQQRLVFASTKNDPARVWMSATGDFYNFASREVMTDSDAIDFIMPITRFAKINHIMEMRKLIMFNSACEWLVDSASTTSGLTYKTIQAYPQSYSGSSARLKPIVCNNVLLFASLSCQEVRRLAWDLSNDGYAGKDISILSSSIFKDNSIKDWTYQQFPNSTIWMALSDGTMASLTYMEEQEVIAWSTHELGGGGKVISMATTYAMAPALDEVVDVDYRAENEAYDNATQTEVMAAIKRGNSLWLERMRVAGKKDDSVYHQLCMDGVRVIGGEGFGKNHRALYADTDLVYVDKATDDGVPLTFAEAMEAGWFVADGDGGYKAATGKEIYEGYIYDAVYVSTYPIVRFGAIGMGQFDVKNIQNVGFRLAHAHGGEIAAYDVSGIPQDNWEPIRYDDTIDARPKFNGDGTATFFDFDAQNVKPIGVNSRDGRVILRQHSAWPIGILMYELDINGERGGEIR